MSQILNELNVKDPHSLYDFIDRHNAFLLNFLSYFLQDKEDIKSSFKTILNSAIKNFDKLKEKENQSLFLIKGCLKISKSHEETQVKLEALKDCLYEQSQISSIEEAFFSEQEYDLISYHASMMQKLSEQQYLLLQLLCVERFTIDEIADLFNLSSTMLEAHLFQLSMNLCGIDHTSLEENYDIVEVFSHFIQTPIHKISIDSSNQYHKEESRIKKILQLASINRYHPLAEKDVLKSVRSFFPEFELKLQNESNDEESIIDKIRQQNEEQELEKYSQVQMNQEDLVEEYNVQHVKPQVNEKMFLYSKVACGVLIFFMFFTAYQSFQSPNVTMAKDTSKTKHHKNLNDIHKVTQLGLLYMNGEEAQPFYAGSRVKTKDHDAEIILSDQSKITISEYTNLLMVDSSNIFLSQGDISIEAVKDAYIMVRTQHGQVQVKNSHTRIAKVNRNYSLAASLKNQTIVLYNQKEYQLQSNEQMVFGLEEKAQKQSYESSSFSISNSRKANQSRRHQFNSFNKSYNRLSRSEKRNQVILLKQYQQKPKKKHLEFLQNL